MSGEEVVVVAARPQLTSGPGLRCVTQDPLEPAAPQYRAVCTETADRIANSAYCPPELCGGHPVCNPCYALAKREGLLR